MDPISVAATAASVATIYNTVNTLMDSGKDIADAGQVSLTSYVKPLCITSRVYIDEAVYADPIVTDVIKTVHTQYAAFVLTALQMNRFVTKDRDVQSMLRVVATESMLPHESVAATFSAADDEFERQIASHDRETRERNREQRDIDKTARDIIKDQEKRQADLDRITRENAREEAKKLADEKRDEIREAADLARATREADRDAIRTKFDEARAVREAAKDKREAAKADIEKEIADKLAKRNVGIAAGTISSASATGKVVELDGNNHVPAGKVIEVTLTNPDNPLSNVTMNLLIQLAPYLIPSALAVHFISKDIIPSFSQRVMQWRTGEISFWKDLVALSDITTRRERLRRMDPTGVLDAAINKQTSSRGRALMNLTKDQAARSRNIANSVLIFSRETVQRAKVESGIDITNPQSRQSFFNTSFAMILVVVDTLYDRVTFYYNGLDDEATFSFDQMKLKNKGDSGLDLVAVMNALGQGRSPKF